MSFALILPFLKPIEYLIVDPDISEIMVNAGGRVFFERAGRISAAAAEMPEEHLQAAIRSIARLLGNDVGEAMPLLDARLPDGSRVAATLPPASVGGSTLTIRRFRYRHFTTGELVRCGMMTDTQMEIMRAAVENRETMLISGSTGSGKTTLLNALADLIPPHERIVIIEDTAEISLQLENLVRLEARRSLPDLPAITIQELLRQSLRMRPDRILLGEVRGSEAWDLLQALNTGHSGSLSTLHANSARMAGTRLLHCVQMAGMGIPAESISASIADAINLLVHVERRDGKRYVKELMRVRGYNPDTNQYELEDTDA